MDVLSLGQRRHRQTYHGFYGIGELRPSWEDNERIGWCLMEGKDGLFLSEARLLRRWRVLFAWRDQNHGEALSLILRIMKKVILYEMRMTSKANKSHHLLWSSGILNMCSMIYEPFSFGSPGTIGSNSSPSKSFLYAPCILHWKNTDELKTFDSLVIML